MKFWFTNFFSVLGAMSNRLGSDGLICFSRFCLFSELRLNVFSSIGGDSLFLIVAFEECSVFFTVSAISLDARDLEGALIIAQAPFSPEGFTFRQTDPSA
ncbi:hypothetical protein [Leptospira ainlahdjerensis]|uniref:hypothetical protein n=1 Tax=Leptospira ainlahdjerensis TaxID=2810033 RepID=UPI001E3DC78C|nr:hypothetical protein [Leptospira ainlahdjerensis]